jgi:hypothetical protein
MNAAREMAGIKHDSGLATGKSILLMYDETGSETIDKILMDAFPFA